jgi:phosphatidylglycerophosphate synthase
MFKNKKGKFNNFSDFSKKAFPKEKLNIDPFLSRYYRPLSLRISWYLFRSGIKPNSVTFAQIFIGLLGCYLIVSLQNQIGFLLGILFLHSAYVLDCVDGEIARVTQTESLQGLFLDKFAHAITMPCIFMSVGIYYSQYSPENIFFILLINLFASFSTFNPVNRLVNSIILQLFIKKDFKQYDLKNYKNSNKNILNLQEKNFDKGIFLNFLFSFKNLRLYKFALHSFRHVTYLALISLFFVLECLGLSPKIILCFWLIVGLSLIFKEISMLYFVVSTEKIELDFLKLKNFIE